MQRIDECSLSGNKEFLGKTYASHSVHVTAETELLNVDFKRRDAGLQLEHCQPNHQSTETNGKFQSRISLAYIIFLLEGKYNFTGSSGCLHVSSFNSEVTPRFIQNFAGTLWHSMTSDFVLFNFLQLLRCRFF